MGAVFALLVGIDAYQQPIDPLMGCANDIRHLEQYVVSRVGDSADVLRLIDGDATRAKIIDGFRNHLAKAGPNDVALFAYSGHGSEEPVPEAIAGSEASGRLQNLVVVDSGREADGQMVRPLADKELGLLLSEVGASGAHVAAVMDCCHSGDLTRDLSTAVTRQWMPDQVVTDDPVARSVVEFLASQRPDDRFLAGALERVVDADKPDHVALYACRPTELANENVIGGERRGAFSAALIDVLAAAGPTTTYRSLVAAARARIERDYERQHPSVYPDTPSGPADAPFLGGSVRPTPPMFSLTKGSAGWEIDAGAVHGLRSAVGAESFRLACLDTAGDVVGHVRVVEVGAGRSTVEPEGWEPQDIAYGAVIATAPRPLATFHFADGEHSSPPALVEAVRHRLATCSPDAGPSPFVREHEDRSAGVIDFGLSFEREGFGEEQRPCLRIVRADGSTAIRTAPTIPCDDIEAAAATVVDRLEHIAKWEQRKESSPLRPELADDVRVRLYPRRPDDTTVPAERQPLVATGEYVIPVDADGGRRLWVQIDSRSDDERYVALLGLTDDFGCSVYQPTAQMTAGVPVNLRLAFQLSHGVEVRPGARSHEWMRLIVSETDFDSSDFELESLRSTADRGGAEPKTRGRVETGPEAAPVDVGWWSTTIGIVLEVPASPDP